MVAAEAARPSVATVEAPLPPGQETDAAGTGGRAGVTVSHQRARPLVERRGLAHERSVSDSLLSKPGVDPFDGSAPSFSERLVNRRVRNRTHGGVGGRRGQPRLLPDWTIIADTGWIGERPAFLTARFVLGQDLTPHCPNASRRLFLFWLGGECAGRVGGKASRFLTSTGILPDHPHSVLISFFSGSVACLGCS